MNPLSAMHPYEASSRQERELPGIAWNSDEQVQLLTSFSYNDELATLPRHQQW